MNLFQRRKILKNANYLEMIPVQVSAFKEEPTGLITLLIAKFKNKKLSRFFFGDKETAFIHIHLDEFGSYVWKNINGKNTLEDICINMDENFKDKIVESRIRVAKFLTKLYDNRIITFKQLEAR